MRSDPSLDWHPLASLNKVWHRLAGPKKPLPAYGISEEFRDVSDDDLAELRKLIFPPKPRVDTTKLAGVSPIRKLLYNTNKPMSNQEIADALGISKGHCSRQVSRLVDAGFLTRIKTGRMVLIHCRHWSPLCS